MIDLLDIFYYILLTKTIVILWCLSLFLFNKDFTGSIIIIISMDDTVPIAKIRHLHKVNSKKSHDSNRSSLDKPSIPTTELDIIRQTAINYKGYAAQTLNIKTCGGKSETLSVHPLIAFQLHDGFVKRIGRYCTCSVALKNISENPQLTIRRKLILEKYYKSFKKLYVLLAVTEEGEEYYYSFSLREIQVEEYKNKNQILCSQCGKL